MSPTVETTTEYKSSTRSLICQFPCATRAPSPPESVSSDHSCSGSSTSTSHGVVGDSRKYVPKRKALAKSGAFQKVHGSQENGQNGTGIRNAERDTPLLPCDSGTVEENFGKDPLDANRNINSNSNARADIFSPSIHRGTTHPTPRLPPQHVINKDIDQPSSVLNAANSATRFPGPLRSAAGLCTFSPSSPFLPLSSPATVGPLQTNNNLGEGQDLRKGPTPSGGDNVKRPLSPNYVRTGTHTKMAAEGDNSNQGESVAQNSSVKPRLKVTSDPSHVSHQFFHLEPCLYSHRMFTRAAQIFGVLKQDDADTEENQALRRRQGGLQVDKQKIPEMDFIDAQEQIKTFELTFATLKFQKLFSSILDYIGFFHEFPNLRRLHSMCYVILFDLQSRKFQRRVPFPDEVIDPDCQEVEDALHDQRTKLQANIAKERVKNHAPSIEYLLPEHVRNKDETKTKTPVYLWVNQFKTTLEEAIEGLKSRGFGELFGKDMSQQTGSVFSVDSHCSDLLTFPPNMDMEIKTWDSVTSGLMVQQDKSSCLAPQSVPLLLGPDHDVIHVNVGTAVSTCHLSSLLRHKCPNSHIFAFGVDSTEKARKVAKNIEYLGVRNVRVIPDEFLSVDPEDPRFKSVRVILITANCSKSAITSPVQFIVSEGEDTQILGKLSVGDTDMTLVGELMAEHERLLKHSLRFPKLQAVVYTTRSRHEAENDVVVTKVLEFINMTNGKKPLFKVVPPVIPFCADEINSESNNGVDGRYIRFRPSDRANGCFVAVIAKEPEESRDSRTAQGKSKSKLSLTKTKSAPSGLADDANSVEDGKSGKSNGKGGRKSLKGGNSSTEMKTSGSANSLKLKLSQHKSPAAAGARLYQAGLIKKMENGRGRTSPTKPEHMKVIKHPAPFR